MLDFVLTYFIFCLQSNQLVFILQLLSIFTIITSLFDVYCLAMAEPGTNHYGYYVISYQFVYVGNKHGRLYFVVHCCKQNTQILCNYHSVFQFYVIFCSSQHIDCICPFLSHLGIGYSCYQLYSHFFLEKGQYLIIKRFPNTYTLP